MKTIMFVNWLTLNILKHKVLLQNDSLLKSKEMFASSILKIKKVKQKLKQIGKKSHWELWIKRK